MKAGQSKNELSWYTCRANFLFFYVSVLSCNMHAGHRVLFHMFPPTHGQAHRRAVHLFDLPSHVATMARQTRCFIFGELMLPGNLIMHVKPWMASGALMMRVQLCKTAICPCHSQSPGHLDETTYAQNKRHLASCGDPHDLKFVRNVCSSGQQF